MALPLMGALIGAQVLSSVVGGVFSLISSGKQHEMQKEQMGVMREQQQWQRAQFQQAFGAPQGQGYPPMG